MQYRDYYDILGVSRDATAEQIRKAFRTLARKHHPDANKGDKSSTEKFKEISEAYEVLKDEKKRKMYDQLGPNWKAGQDFTPPPDFGGRGRPPFSRSSGQGAPDFSDFFQSIFGGAAGRGGSVRFPGGYDFQGGDGGFNGGPAPPQDQESEIAVPIEKVMAGESVSIDISDETGTRKRLDVRIPKAIADGKRIRLAGQAPGGGDLYLRIRVQPGKFRLEGNDVIADLPLTPTEAALGASVSVTTPDGDSISLTIPPETSSGRRLRIRGKGLKAAENQLGDLFFQINVMIPRSLSEAEKKLYEKLGKEREWNPREAK